MMGMSKMPGKMMTPRQMDSKMAEHRKNYGVKFKIASPRAKGSGGGMQKGHGR